MTVVVGIEQKLNMLCSLLLFEVLKTGQTTAVVARWILDF